MTTTTRLPIGREHAIRVKVTKSGQEIWKWAIREAYARNGNSHNPTQDIVWESRTADGRVVMTGGRMRDVI